jgi:glyoxylase-like metal-dependent hydrolase (beta-lactamase superfamily II)
MFKRETIEVTVADGSKVKVHAISTGSVAVKTKFRESERKGWLGTLDFIMDKTFTEWLPIWVWVIEYDDKVFVIDTGENSEINRADYFNSSGAFAKWFNRRTFRFKVEPNQNIDVQLREINISPEDVNTVILTHLHLDHFDGLKHFPKSKILVNEEEWQKPYGDLPVLYPPWFNPQLLKMNDTFRNFSKAICINKDITAIHTPGHTHGNISIVLQTKDAILLFAGDVCYHQSQLITESYSGVNVDSKKARETYRQIKQLAATNNVVFLPSHDKESANRLKNMIPL